MANAPSAEDDMSVKAVNKRFEGLMTVRSKAIKGKGAWYWAHLEPILIHNQETGLPKAVKLRCGLCEAVFSASNPSRTASEHLKRGTCPNFTGTVPKPISSFSISPSPLAATAATSVAASHTRKRGGGASGINSATSSHHHHHHHSLGQHQVQNQPMPLAMIDCSPRFCSEMVYPPPSLQAGGSGAPLVLSGGKEDLGALAMLEDSVKKLKSPKASPGPALTKAQVEAAVGLLADWLYESCGSVSFSCVDHPKFRSFLQQVGLPPISRREIAGPKLDARYEEVRSDSEAKLQDAMFFQLASNGWRKRNWTLNWPSAQQQPPSPENVVSITLNLPNGTSLFRKAVFTSSNTPSKYAEDVLWDAVTSACEGGPVQRCAGIVADRFKAKALRSLESQNHWMVNLCCQLQGLSSLIKDFSRQLPLFRSVAESCVKLANFFNTNSRARTIFHRYQLQALDHHHPNAAMLRVPPPDSECPFFAATAGAGDDGGFLFATPTLDDIMNSARVLQLVVLDESYKLVCQENPVAQEVSDMTRDMDFWNELEAVLALVKLIKAMAQDIEADRPLVGRCLPLWEELRSKVKEWCDKYNIQESPVEKVIERRFKKNYHPAWSAAYILDPLYLYRDASGKYLPPFKCLTPEQEKDVDKLITRLVSREEAHIALMELMKWRSEGLDPLYAQAVQVKQRDPLTGKMKVANPQSSRLVWETCLSEFKSLGKVAVRLIFLHATSCSFKCNWSFLRWVSAHGHSRTGMDRAQKLIFIAAHSKLERRDFSSEEEKDAELFANGEDDVLNEVLLDSSV
ncbi:unnamed protein product [Victoria cruziana]